MTRFSPVVHRHDLWHRIRDLAEEIVALTDEWRQHDPELQEIDQALDAERATYEITFDETSAVDAHAQEEDPVPW